MVDGLGKDRMSPTEGSGEGKVAFALGTNDKLDENERAASGEERVLETKIGQDCGNERNKLPEDETDAPQHDASEKEEYLRLIRDRFKSYFTEDMERIVGRRVKKYKNELQRLKEGTSVDENRENELEALSGSEPLHPVNVEEKRADTGNSETALELKDNDLTETTLAEKISLHADGIQAKYPQFSLEAAMSDGRFLKLAEYALSTGEMTVEEAYRAASADEIAARAADEARRETEERMLSSVHLRRARPVENGIGARTSVCRTHPSRLTRREREDIAKRAAKGEKIHF